MPSGRRRTLLGKLMGAYLLLTLGLLGAFGLLAHALGRRALDEELGKRLVSIAQATAASIYPGLFVQLGPGDEQTRTYANLKRKLDELKVRTQAARIELLDPSFRIRVDTEAQIPIGAEAYELVPDRAELEQALAGKPCASVFFRGKDGQFYKRGYAPIFADGSNQVIGVAAIWGSTEYFRQLGEFRRWLLLCGGAGALLVIAVSVAVARRITGPLEELAQRAERIGQGDLSIEIPQPQSRDEVGLLGEAMAQMRRGLAARDQRMQMMLAGIAHEIRNPLGGMELFAGLLREELAGDPAKLEHTLRIERELGHLKRIVSEFLDFARRARPELGAVDCAALLSNVQELIQTDCARGGLELSCAVAGNPVVRADIGQLRRALLNLVHNAISATSPGGSVTLRCENGDGRVRLAVSDTGSGIPTDQLANIFVPFFSTKERGMGLGLAFVKDIVTDHGGHVSVESQPGRGSTFTIELPPWEPSSSSTTTKPSEKA